MIRLLHLRRLREQPLRALLAVVAIAAGTTLLVGVLVDRASLVRTLGDFVDQRAGAATLEVTGPGGPAGTDAALLPVVRSVEGVGTAVPLVQTITIAEDATGAERFVIVFGVDCTIEAVFGTFGCEQAELDAAADLFITSPSLAAGLGVDGVIRSSAGRIPLAGAVALEQLEVLNRGNVVVFPLARAQQVFGFEGALGSILVVPAPGADHGALRSALEDAVGPHNRVLEPGMAGDAEFASVLVAMLFLMSLFALAIGAQLVHNIVTLTLEERRRDLAVVGAIGAPPRTILAGTLAEAAVLGLLGGILGVGGGALLGRPLVNGMSDSIDEIVGIRLDVHVPPSAFVASVVLGILTSVAAAYGPARRASRLDVAGELHGHARRTETDRATRGRRAVVYVALSGVGLVLAWLGWRDGAIEPWQPIATYAGFGLAVVLPFRAAQHGAAPLLSAAARLPVLRDGPARVAIANLSGQPKRTGVMILALAGAVGTGIVLGNINASIVEGSGRFGEVLAETDSLYVSTLEPNNTLGIAAKPSRATIDRISAIEGVDRLDVYHAFCGNHPDTVGSFCIHTTDLDTESTTVFRGRTTITETFAAGEVAVGAGLARALDLAPGDEIQVPGRTAMHTLRIGTIWDDADNTGRAISVPLDRFVEMYGDRPAQSMLVRPAPGVDGERLGARIEAAGIDPDLVVYDGDEMAAALRHNIKGFVTPFAALQRGMLVVALIAVTSTLLLVGVQRRREHGLLLAVGMAPGGLGRLVLGEAGIIGITGSVLGTVAGLVTYMAMMWVSPLFTGLRAPFTFDVTAPLIYGGIGLVFVLIGAALPAWRTSRLDPATALRYE